VSSFRGPAGSFLPAICLGFWRGREKAKVWLLEMLGSQGRARGKVGNLEVADEYSMLYELGSN